jgi:hypothetical protein
MVFADYFPFEGELEQYVLMELAIVFISYETTTGLEHVFTSKNVFR